MKKLFSALSALMIIAWIILAGCEHDSDVVQLIISTAGVLVSAGGTALAMVVTA